MIIEYFKQMNPIRQMEFQNILKTRRHLTNSLGTKREVVRNTLRIKKK